MENKFYKVGDTLSFKPNTQGIEANLEGGKVYNILVDQYTDAITIKESSDLQLPSKIYSSEKDSKFINKVLNTFDKSAKGFTGVMLSGLKGSGKTITAKRIAINSRLPIILVTNWLSPRVLSKVVNNLGDLSVCFLFDEFDKISEDYNTSYLLQTLDGVATNGKHLIVFTCNNIDGISDHLVDRCSRVRYWKDFDALPTSTVLNVLEERLNDQKEAQSLCDFIMEHFNIVSFDNVITFVDEVNNNPTSTFEELFEDMNLSEKE
jgi:hypothetical protein